MTDTNLPLTADGDFDDLPRTLRRERDRQAAGSAGAAAAAAPAYEVASSGFDDSYGAQPAPASVERINVPFFKLMFFLMKAVLAAIPALILLAVILWFAGQALQAVFPELVQMKILISFPGETNP